MISRDLIARTCTLLQESITLKRQILAMHTEVIVEMAQTIAQAISRGNKVMLCGNGGSAADAQHIAAEFLVRFNPKLNRRPLPALALHTDTSTLTACANDYGYDQVFSRLVEGIGVAGDVLMGLSTSGKSANIIRALGVARRQGITTLGVLGGDGGEAKALCDFVLVVPSAETGRIQEVHITLGHIIVELVEEILFGMQPGPPPTLQIKPLTLEDLVAAFSHLGVHPGENVVIHASLSSIGYVVNGAHDVIEALDLCVGPKGTVLMPAHSGQLTDPADWQNPPLPSAEWIDVVRNHMRFFDAATTEVRNRGVIAETFLTYPGTVRSNHPIASMAARGARAAEFTRNHPLHASQGEGSPAWHFWRANGLVLLIGVDLASCTFIHLAEFLADVPYLSETRVRVLVRGPNGQRTFVKLEKYPGDSTRFNKLIPLLRDAGAIASAEVNGGRLLAFKLRAAVDIALAKLRDNPYYFVN